MAPETAYSVVILDLEEADPPVEATVYRNDLWSDTDEPLVVHWSARTRPSGSEAIAGGVVYLERPSGYEENSFEAVVTKIGEGIFEWTDRGVLDGREQMVIVILPADYVLPSVRDSKPPIRRAKEFKGRMVIYWITTDGGRHFSWRMEKATKQLQAVIDSLNREAATRRAPTEPKTIRIVDTVDVGIVIALAEEFAELFNEIEDRHESFPDVKTGREHYMFEQSGMGSAYRCVVTFVGDMGATQSALVTHRLIERWQPHTLVMLGIAAAMSKDVRIGDVVVADQIDSYLDNSKAVPDQGPDTFKLNLSGEVYRSSEDLRNETQKFQFKHRKLFQSWQNQCEQELSQLVPPEQYQQLIAQQQLRAKVRTISGILASGPTVGAAQGFIDWLKTRNRKYMALEMEAAGFMAAIHQGTGVKRTLVLRAISDYGDERKQALDTVQEGVFRGYAMRNAIQLHWKFFEAGTPSRT